MHNVCQYCGARFGGEEGILTCSPCWELFEEEGGAQLDPAEHPRATEVASE